MEQQRKNDTHKNPTAWWFISLISRMIIIVPIHKQPTEPQSEEKPEQSSSWIECAPGEPRDSFLPCRVFRVLSGVIEILMNHPVI